MWFIGVEVEQEASAPPPRKNPGPAPALMSSSPIMPKHTCLLFQKPHQSPGLRYGSFNLKL